ncbi:MAG: hypothetical protein BWZ08_00640 [candidate division BRC1 bacterium ADurb.BinA292]|nr:MAG: hypothetical protein BWZ08_00640 [candidate division BRC1 bacterium ADurb.BinA292]
MFAIPGIDYIMEMLPWALGVFVALVLLFIFWKIWRAVVSNRVRKIQTAAGMQFSDIDRMRKTGGITEEEYKRIRQAMARQTMQAMEEQRRIEAERSIFERARMNPEAAREFLRTGRRQRRRAGGGADDAAERGRDPRPYSAAETPSRPTGNGAGGAAASAAGAHAFDEHAARGAGAPPRTGSGPAGVDC